MRTEPSQSASRHSSNNSTRRREAASGRPLGMDEWMFGWQFKAACRGEDAAMFFAPNYFEKRHEKDAREERARVYCNRCEVREQCLEYALRIREPHGMWGGMNEAQRRALLRVRDREAEESRRAG